MAEDDPRVHKASEVHKRKPVDRADRAAVPASAPAPGGSPAETPASDAPKTPTKRKPPSKQDVKAAKAARAKVAEGERAVAPAPGEAIAPGAAPAPAPAPAASPAAPAAPPRKRWGLRIALALVGALAAAALVLAGFAAGSRWVRFNDVHDVQGTWYVAGTDVSITITDSVIALNASTSYSYEVDPTAKTIAYSLGNLSGQGRYWFSDDRQTLVITDGEYSMWDTLIADAGYVVRHFFGDDSLPAGDGSIVLGKVITLPGSGSSAGSGGSAGEDGEALSAEDRKARDEAAQQEQQRQQQQQGAEGEAAQGDGAAQSARGGDKDFDDLSISDALAKGDGSADEEGKA